MSGYGAYPWGTSPFGTSLTSPAATVAAPSWARRITDWFAQALQFVPAMFQQPNFLTLLRGFATVADAFDIACGDCITRRMLDTAEGAQLDQYGAVVGAARNIYLNLSRISGSYDCLTCTHLCGYHLTQEAPMEKTTHDRVCEFVRDRILAGEPPTVREVQQRFGFRSSGTARDHLDRLVAEGRLAKLESVSRGFRLPEGVRTPRPVRQIPILGRVQAGALTMAVEDIEGYLPMPADGVGADLFALRVQGDSMNRAGILPGDLIIVRRQDDADNGDVVVAMLDDTATVKRLHKRHDHIELRPESDNQAFAPMRLGGEAVRLLGKVVEVRRRL